MTDNRSVEKAEQIIEEENKNCLVLEGATETETSDFFEESGVVCGETVNKEFTSDFESDSDVINSFIQNTNNEVGIVVFKYILRQL